MWGVLAAASILVLVQVERRAAHPIFPFGLFRSRTVSVATTVGFLSGIGLFGAIAFIPLLVQATTSASATSAGQILTPIYLMWVLASIVAARLLLRIGARASTLGGTTAVFIAFAMLPFLAVGASRAALFADMGLMGAGLGFAMLALLLAVQHSVSKSELGVATSLNMFARQIGGAVGAVGLAALLLGNRRELRIGGLAAWGVGCGALTVYLEISFQSAWRRIGKLAGRPLISGRTPSEVEALFERRRKRYEQAAHRVDGDRPPGEVADEVMKLWSA